MEGVTEDMLKCYEFHHRACPYREPHPLIHEKEWYDFRTDYMKMIRDKTMEATTAPGNLDVYYNTEYK